MAKDTLGMTFEARGPNEVPNLAQVQAMVNVELIRLRGVGKLSNEHAPLCEIAARNTTDRIEKAALYLLAGELSDFGGAMDINARKVMDRHIVEECRKLVFDVYGAPLVDDVEVELPLEPWEE